MTPYLRQALTLSLILSLLLFSVSCASSKSAETRNSTPTFPATVECGALPPARSTFAIQDGPATQIATKVATDVGKVITSGQGSTDRTIFIFEETHDSRLAQMEIAVMLWRLQRDQGLRQISLEGAFAANGDLPATWFHTSTNAGPNRAHQEVALTLLKQGEISAAEFMALAASAVRVRGNEIESEYKVEASKNNAALGYLDSIAERSLTQIDIKQINGLIAAKQNREALKVIFSKDSWARERYEKLYGDEQVAGTEEAEIILQEIEQKANELGLRIPSQDQAEFREDQAFYQTASKRSCTIVKNTLEMMDPANTAPLALIIGAAHTPKVVQLIKAAKLTYVVLAPASMGKPHKATDLTGTSYQRKMDLKSVDEAGALGAILDGRKKPPPVVGKIWFRSKTQTFEATDLIVAAAAKNEPIPSEKLTRELDAFDAIRISSIKKISQGDQVHVIFKVTARTSDTDPDQRVTFWGNGSYQPPPGPPGTRNPGDFDSDDNFDLEKLILEARDEERKKDDQPISKPPKVAVVQLTTRTRAAFSTDPSLLQAVTAAR
jgi:hypothetical protein